MKDFLLSIKNKTENKLGIKIHLSLLIPATLFILMLNFYLINTAFEDQIKGQNISAVSFNIASPALYPVLNSVLGSNTNGRLEDIPFEINAKSAVIMDNDSKVILFSKNPNLHFSMASTTKIMTALTALDHYKLNDVLTVYTENIEPYVVGFKKGEKVYFEDLLYGMLVPSGNDAALAIAQNYPEGEEEFVKKMNENAARFGLLSMHFSDPVGFDNDTDYTTADDLARLASVALKNQTFSKIVSTKKKNITSLDGETYTLKNLNQLLGKNGVNGVKTGYTDEAGGILVTSSTKNNHTYIIVVMKSSDRFRDSEKLLSFLDNISYLRF